MNDFYNICFVILSLLGLFSNVWAIPLEDLIQKEELLIDKSVPNILLENQVSKKEKYILLKKIPEQERKISGQLMERNSLSEASTELRSESKEKNNYFDQTDYYLFEQDELAGQQEGLGIYETLAPMLSSEAKKDAKKLWENTADFREAIKGSDVDAETQALVLTKASTDITEYKGKSLEELAGKALPPRLTEVKDPDKEVVHELFVRLYELLKNAFLIIISVLVIAKVTGLLLNKLLSRKKRRRSRKSARGHTRTPLEASRKPRRRRRRSATV